MHLGHKNFTFFQSGYRKQKKKNDFSMLLNANNTLSVIWK
jgi:hypothetical protein